MKPFQLETLDFLEVCPHCQENKKLACYYDTYYIPEEKQEKICQDCIDIKAEKESEKLK